MADEVVQGSWNVPGYLREVIVQCGFLQRRYGRRDGKGLDFFIFEKYEAQVSPKVEV
jgi:hypothetical protein